MSLDAFAQLTMIAPVNGLAEIDGREYGVIVSGLIHLVVVMIMMTMLC